MAHNPVGPLVYAQNESREQSALCLHTLEVAEAEADAEDEVEEALLLADEEEEVGAAQ